MGMTKQPQTKQTSIQMDDEWRRMVDQIADKWGFRKGRHVTQILRACTLRVWATEVRSEATKTGESSE